MMGGGFESPFAMQGFPAAPMPQPDMRLVGRILSKRLTGELATLSEQQPTTFRAFWEEFGAYFDRNGQALDEHRQRLAGPAVLEAQSA